VVGEAASGRELLTKASALNPDVVLVNAASIPEVAWLDFVEILAQNSPAMRGVLTSLRDDTEHLGSLLKTATQAMEQPLNKDRLTIALSVTRDAPARTAGSPEKFRGMQMPGAVEPSLRGGSLLSPREHEVLLLLAEGYSNREVAERIFRSVKTVEAYRASVKKKLGLRNRSDIVHYVRELGSQNRTA